MKTVRVQGCLPTLAVLLSVLAVGLVVAFLGTVGLAIGAGAAILFAAMRLARRLLGLGGATRPVRGAGDSGAAPGTVEVLPPGWVEGEATGPIVDVPARPAGGPGDTGAPEGSGERDRLPRG